MLLVHPATYMVPFRDHLIYLNVVGLMHLGTVFLRCRSQMPLVKLHSDSKFHFLSFLFDNLQAEYQAESNLETPCLAQGCKRDGNLRDRTAKLFFCWTGRHCDFRDSGTGTAIFGTAGQAKTGQNGIPLFFLLLKITIHQ